MNRLNSFTVSVLSGALLLTVSATSQATIIVVDTTEDSTVVNGNCSLREAVIAANTNTATDDCAAGSATTTDDIWVFVAGTIAVSSQLPLLERVTLLGGGMDTTTISGQGFSSVFYVDMPDDSHNVGISNLTVADGKETLPGGGMLVVRAGRIRVENCRFRDNESSNYGGAIGLRLAAGVSSELQITQSMFENNSASRGGAIGVNGYAPYVAPQSVTIDRSSFIGNSVIGNGGAIFLPNVSSVSVDRSRFHDNLASPLAPGSGGLGGAIYSVEDGSGIMAVSNSTFTGNFATNGGAIVSFVPLSTITNSTFSDNRTTAAIGNALYVRNGTAGIFHSTFIGNGAPNNLSESVLHAGSGGSILITHSIVWSEESSADPACATSNDGVFQSSGYNIDAGTSCSGASSDYSNVADPGVFDLGDYGDNTGVLVLETFLPHPDGLQVDGGKDAPCTGAFGGGLATDQRGETRPIDGDGSGGNAECDIGAVEYQPGVDPVARTLELAVFDTGSGRIEDAAGNILCTASNNDCDQQLPDGATVSLTAVAETGSVFTGWDEDCFDAGTGVCTLTMDQDLTVSAGFQLAAQPATLTLSKDLSEPGLDAVITSTPTGINCGTTCIANFSVGDSVTLIAAPEPGTLVSGWAGCDNVSANGLNCTVSLQGNRQVEAFLDNSGELIFSDGFDQP